MAAKNYDDWYQGWFKDNVKAPYLRDAWEAATKAAEEKFTSTNSAMAKLLDDLDALVWENTHGLGAVSELGRICEQWRNIRQ